MHSIVLATDFSPRSDRALLRSSLIARKTGASLTLLHVVDGDQPDRLISSDVQAASDLLTEAALTLQKDHVQVEWLVKIDDVHAGIQSAAEELGADLIVIGPHRKRLRDVFTGTTAERILHVSTFPLLVAVEPPTAHHTTTLLALDFDDASKTAARKSLELGVFDHTDVVIMHAFDAPAESMMRRSMQASSEIEHYVDGERAAAAAKLRALVNELDLPETARTVVSMKGSAARSILETAQEVQSDLVVLGTNQRKGFERALVGSVTADVIRDASRDVLIVPVDVPVETAQRPD